MILMMRRSFAAGEYHSNIYRGWQVLGATTVASADDIPGYFSWDEELSSD
jgi:hypothetical protein